jgi:hypothetical protein
MIGRFRTDASFHFEFKERRSLSCAILRLQDPSLIWIGFFDGLRISVEKGQIQVLVPLDPKEPNPFS